MVGKRLDPGSILSSTPALTGSVWLVEETALRKAKGSEERQILGRDTFSDDSSKAGQFYYKHLTLHCGRHTFCSHALAGGRSLAEVREAAGHKSLATTDRYVHMALDDDGTVGDLFTFGDVG